MAHERVLIFGTPDNPLFSLSEGKRKPGPLNEAWQHEQKIEAAAQNNIISLLFFQQESKTFLL